MTAALGSRLVGLQLQLHLRKARLVSHLGCLPDSLTRLVINGLQQVSEQSEQANDEMRGVSLC